MTDTVWNGPGDLPVEYLVALGRLTIDWSRIEDCIDGVCVIAHNHLGGREEFPRDPLPRGLDKKLTYMKKCFKTLPRLSEWRTEALTLIEKIHTLKSERHRLTHGVAMVPETGTHIDIMKWRYTAETFYTERSKITVVEVTRLRMKMKPLIVAWVNLVMALCYEFNPTFFDKKPSKIAG